MGKKKQDVVEAEGPATVTNSETAATLYCNRNGSVECEEHAPRKETQTWRLDHWRKMTAEDVEALEREFGRKIACVTCAPPKASETTEAAPPADTEPAAPKQKGKKARAEVEAPATETKPTLLWNERGQIGCTIPGHAPHKGTDTWRFEHWKRVPEGTLNEDGTPIVCETCARAGAAPAVGETPAESGADAATEPEAPKRKGKRTKADMTLADLAERYVAHLEEAGKSAGTSASYGLEMKTALSELGAETKLADLKPEQVLAYFASKRVTRKKSGKHKSPLSIAKTCRVLRLALVWAVERKLIEKAPLPETLATH